jgi:imidazolonepropionase
MTLFNTFMAAHAIPPEAKSSDEYIEQVVLPIMTNKELVKSFDFVDIFHEKNYFNTNNCRNLFDYAKLCKIPVKIHADELNDNGGAELAVQYDAVSADHLMCINDTAIKKISQSKTVAVMLPGTSLFLGKKLAPARMLIDSGSILAIASDFNPGSCHFDNLLLLAAMSAPMLKLNIAETIAGITYNAAKAVARNDLGHLCVGGPPNMSLFKCDSYEQIFYNWGYNYSVNNQFNFNQSFI